MNNTNTAQADARKQKALREAISLLEKEIDIRLNDPKFFGYVGVRVQFENGSPTLARPESGPTVKIGS